MKTGSQISVAAFIDELEQRLSGVSTTAEKEADLTPFERRRLSMSIKGAPTAEAPVKVSEEAKLQARSVRSVIAEIQRNRGKNTQFVDQEVLLLAYATTLYRAAAATSNAVETPDAIVNESGTIDAPSITADDATKVGEGLTKVAAAVRAIGHEQLGIQDDAFEIASSHCRDYTRQFGDGMQVKAFASSFKKRELIRPISKIDHKLNSGRDTLFHPSDGGKARR